MNETFNVAPGGFVESYQPRNKINMIYGVWVDNFSGGWLNIDGHNLWIPPYTRGWKASIFPGMSTITVRSYDFARGAIITGATGQSAVVTLWDEDKGDSEGTEFFDQQTIPLVYTTVVTGSIVVGTLLAAPAVGRYRVYEVSLAYQLILGVTYPGRGSSVSLVVYPSNSLYFAQVEISPASPKDSQTIQSPGGDAPIGSPILYDLLGADNPNVEYVRISIRYAVL